ncbi:type II methionyl aminopeptidase [Candidatus Woesearchaeota archaeon]|nr:type II methionyl aminopeptidase [Candidatus Woesearchaeota archaeon]
MQNIEDWRKAGRIAAEALAYGKSLIKTGASYFDVTEKIEAKINELGGECAFPVQMSLNDVAAHFTVDPGEDIKFTDQSVSLDVGVHVNGAIGDTACTVDLSGKYADLVKASEEALQEAIKIIKPGIALGEIGKAIHAAITKHGFSPITNLSGHGLDLYDIHTKPTIPNFDTGDRTKLEKGTVIAIEPFATNGAGVIYESSNANIFMLVDVKPVRNPITRKVLQEISNYKNLPFCTRWLAKKFSMPQISFALRELKNLEILKEFPPLPDKAHGIVSQAEHTVLVDDEVDVLTALK